MEQGDSEMGRSSWRKRHPRLARVLLYGALVGIALTALGLLRARRGRDLADRVQYLESRIGMFDLLFTSSGGRQEILAAIKSEGMLDEEMPSSLRQHALRTMAQVFVAEGRLEEASASLDKAEALVVAGGERRALLLEKAELLAMGARPEDALSLLGRDAPWPDPLLELARADEEAYVLAELGRGEDARTVLEEALSRAPTPLPEREGPRVGLTPLKAGNLAIRATRRLAALSEGRLETHAWRRLAALAPNAFDALLEASTELRAAGQVEEASLLLARAREFDPARADRHESKGPDSYPSEDSLKNEDGRGR